MKKRSWLLFLLLCAMSASAQVNVPYDSTFPNAPKTGVTRYSDFPLDNIHILRLQEASYSLGGNVSVLKDELRRYNERHVSAQEEQVRRISQLEGSLDSFQRTVLAQLSSVQSSVSGLATKEPELQAPVEITFPPYLMLLLGLNVFLLVLVIVLIFWLREQYYVHRETHKEEHIHPAPVDLINYVKHQLEHNRSLHDIRIELATKGWTPSVIEHAIHAAREK